MAKFSGLLLAIAVLAPATMMALSNPDRDAYLAYATVQYAPELTAGRCPGIQVTVPTGDANTPTFTIPGVGELTAAACKQLVAFNPKVLQEFAESTTLRQNWLLFSLYTTEIPNQPIKTIGIFNNFWRL